MMQQSQALQNQILQLHQAQGVVGGLAGGVVGGGGAAVDVAGGGALGGAGTSRELVLWVLVLVPLAVVLLQQVLWRRYGLRGAYLGKVKDAVRELRKQQQLVV